MNIDLKEDDRQRATHTAPLKPEWFNHVAPDCSGMNFYDVDVGFQSLLRAYLPADTFAHFEPHFRRLGQLAGGKLDELSRLADKNPPVLHPRDAYGRDQDWIEYHPAYREMERIAFEEFQFHAMSHRPGVLGWTGSFPYVAKYALQYLFVQSEFGLMCPISVTDTSIHLIRRYGSQDLQDYLLPKMLATELDSLWKGTQFMTERAGGSDVGALETIARFENGEWRLYGDKWFCSHTDADIALILARPEGAPRGTKGVGLFALPRRLKDGTRNAYRIVRLKDKLGTRSMASGEITLDGAVAYQIGALDQGLRQMMDQVNLSRVSHAVRAAAMMRRCVNEAMQAARHRKAFGREIIGHPLLRRQVMKLIVPTEQALSMSMFAASMMDLAQHGSNHANDVVRILTPMLKFRACRDNIQVATGSMETRGGNGYIEEWVHARLVRDAHIGVLWEGTSNINAIDIVRRAVGGSKAHEALRAQLESCLAESEGLPASYQQRLQRLLDRTFDFVGRTALAVEDEKLMRQASSALYNIASAIQMAWEGTRRGADARRVLLSRFVVEHRLEPSDPLDPPKGDWEQEATALILSPEPATIEQVAPFLS